jgi:hypothetical protein
MFSEAQRQHSTESKKEQQDYHQDGLHIIAHTHTAASPLCKSRRQTPTSRVRIACLASRPEPRSWPVPPRCQSGLFHGAELNLVLDRRQVEGARFGGDPPELRQHHPTRVPSAVTAIYAVRSTMTALGAHVGAKLQRAVAWVRLHKLDDHRS